MVDIGAVIFLLDQSYQRKKADLVQTVRYALHNAARVFHRKNILVIFVVLFLIPFLNIGVASGYVGSIAVPEFIMDFIKGNVHLLLLFSGVLIGLGMLLLKWGTAWPFCLVLCFCHVGGRACGILRRSVFEAEIGGDCIGIRGMGLSCGFPSCPGGIWHAGKLCLHQCSVLWA